MNRYERRVRRHGQWTIEMWFSDGRPVAVRRSFVAVRVIP